MPTFNWISNVEALSPAALTVRAQSLSPNDTGALLWDEFFPRRDVDSMRLADIVSLDERPVADRREWNARGRYIPMLTPAQREIVMVPIESYDKVEEQEMQRLLEGSFGNAAILEQQIGVRIPDRTNRIALSNYRRLEIDAMNAWTTGQVIQRNPQNATQTFTASFGFSASRLTTAATAWNDVGVNAYDLFLQWFEDSVDLCGPGEGAMMRLATYKAILADAPNLPNTVKMTRTNLVDRIQQDIGGPFSFFINEQSLDVFTDGGTALTRTKVWPTGKVAFIPAGRRVGNTAFAPVQRAWEISNQVPGAGIDVRGVTIYLDPANAGRELTLEAQLNAMAVPDEQKVAVISCGV